MITEIAKITFQVQLSETGYAFDRDGRKEKNKYYTCGQVELSRAQYEKADGWDAVRRGAVLEAIDILDADLPEKNAEGWCVLSDMNGNVIARSQAYGDKTFIIPDDFASRVFSAGDAKFILKLSAKSYVPVFADIVFTFRQRKKLSLLEIRETIEKYFDRQGDQTDSSGKLPDVLMSIVDAIEEAK